MKNLEIKMTVKMFLEIYGVLEEKYNKAKKDLEEHKKKCPHHFVFQENEHQNKIIGPGWECVICGYFTRQNPNINGE